MTDVSDVVTQARQYVSWEPFETFRVEVERALEANDEETLRGMFGKRISFGTAGLRSRMGGGYANMNDLVVIQTSQGLLRYAEANIRDAKTRGILVGYDGRYHSKRFSELICAIFASEGFRVYMFDRIGATPFIPYGILELNAALGVMVTASHNPKADNGYKVYWENGAQIIPPQDAGIAQAILENLEPWNELVTIPLELKEEYNVTERVTESYFQKTAELYSFSKPTNQESDLTVTFTPMHGVGGHWMLRQFEVFNLKPFVPVAEQIEPDPEFPTVAFPNPEEGRGALALAIATADRSNCKIILANDPDSDRLAVAERNDETNEWRIFNGNQIAALMADHVYRKLGSQYLEEGTDPSKLVMIASTVSSKFLASMARHHGFTFVDTLTGFKWMGNTASQMVTDGFKFLFAYEVEIGFLVGDLSFDKDGLRCAAIFNELAIDLYRNGKTCSTHLEELEARYGYFAMITSYFFVDTNETMDQIFGRLRTGFDGSYPNSCGGFVISRVRDVTTGFDSGEPDERCKLPMQPTSHMITFWFENGGVATLRNSGTEPKVKYYLETFDMESRPVAKELCEEMTRSLIDEFIQPELHGLKGKRE